jgi:hypothetical protein
MLLSYLDESNASNLLDLGLINSTIAPALFYLLLPRSRAKKSYWTASLPHFIEKNNYLPCSIIEWNQNNLSRHEYLWPRGP